jgi:small acid-soluble spore protein (thioredoxin-like protein)
MVIGLAFPGIIARSNAKLNSSTHRQEGLYLTPKPDDRRNNVDRIQRTIDRTLHNMEMANELIAETTDPRTKEAMEDKNARRGHALEAMRKEIKDEAAYKDDKKP